jgi:hypothetical protein
LFEFVDRARERRDEMGNHAVLFWEVVVRILGLGDDIAPFKVLRDAAPV